MLLQFAGLCGLRRPIQISVWIGLKGYVEKKQCLEFQCLLFGTLVKGAKADQMVSVWTSNQNQSFSPTHNLSDNFNRVFNDKDRLSR